MIYEYISLVLKPLNKRWKTWTKCGNHFLDIMYILYHNTTNFCILLILQNILHIYFHIHIYLTRLYHCPSMCVGNTATMIMNALKCGTLGVYNALARMLERHVRLKLKVGSIALPEQYTCLYSFMQ